MRIACSAGWEAWASVGVRRLCKRRPERAALGTEPTRRRATRSSTVLNSCLMGSMTLSLAGSALAIVSATLGLQQDTDIQRWHGYRRHDFAVAGRACRLVVPEHAAPGRPWIWRAGSPGFHTDSDEFLLARGFHVAFVEPDGTPDAERALAQWDAIYDAARDEHHLAARPALAASGADGLVADRWAARHPERVACVLTERSRALGGDSEVREVAEGAAVSRERDVARADPLRTADFIERCACALPGGDTFLDDRSALQNCRVRFERERRGRVAFLGGSITFNGGWRDEVCAYLRARFPETEFDFVAAGNPSMGSTPGAFRLARDVFARGSVDLLFQEAAVNDSTNGRTPQEMTRGMEGVLRHARTVNPAIDLVVLHFVDPEKMASYRAGAVPEVIRRHEAVAARYGASSVHLAREVTARIDARQFTWQDDFKDLHPSPFGQRLYAASLRRLLSGAWEHTLVPEAAIAPHALPAALDPFSYDAGALLAPSEAVELEGFTHVAACDPRAGDVGGGVRAGFVDVPMLVGTRPGDRFALEFEGRAVGLWVAAGPDAGTLEHRVDGGSWRKQDLFTRWSGGLHLPWVYMLEAELAVDFDGGPHRLEVRIAATKNERSRGHACRIAHFAVNR